MNRSESHFSQKAFDVFGTLIPFRQYLEGLEPDSVIGHSRTLRICPIAQFAQLQGFPVKEVTSGHLDISVGGRKFAVVGVNRHGEDSDGVLSVEDCSWYLDFICAVDALYPVSTPITAALALLILDSIVSGDHESSQIREHIARAQSSIRFPWNPIAS